MKKIALMMLAATFILCPLTLWAEEVEIHGSIDSEVRGVHVNNDSAKFEEYRDMSGGLSGDAEINVSKESNYLDIIAENIARDDQSYLFRGGRYGNYKISVFYDEIPHNLTYDARSYYTGIGSGNLKANSEIADAPKLWTVFDYTKKREKAGADAELYFKTPFYIEFGGKNEKSNGLYPYSGFRPTEEFPAPIDWQEESAFIGGGYRTQSLLVSLRGDFSEFENKNDTVSRDGTITSLAPDNDYWKMSGKLTWKPDFLSSVLSLRASNSRMENDLNLLEFDPSLETENFEGEVLNTHINAAWNFTPANPLDIKIYTKYHDRDNKSQEVTFDSVDSTPYSYTKCATGFDTILALPARTSMDAGYSYTDTEREGRSDNDKTKDHLAFLQFRNRYWDRVQFRARYEFLNRDGSYTVPEGNDNTTMNEEDLEEYFELDGSLLDPYSSTGAIMYDVAPQQKNSIELETEFYLMDQLGCGLEYAWLDTDYENTVYGLTGVTHHEVYLSSYYGYNTFLYSTIYFGYEYDETDLESMYEWDETTSFDTWAYGILFDIPQVTDELGFEISWNHIFVDGKAEFSPDSGDYENLYNVEDFSRQEFEAKCFYTLADNIFLTTGYLFEKYEFKDDQWEGYTYLSSGATLTGAYAGEDYEAHIVYLTASFRF
ncbi:MAG: MtrB/PioB family outer membrane beta-barrel protein [Desulfobacteraceae bacterium]|nr:MtrB/PioB family outer membrane beta-barrel protein [Desulfobacteraceae bacterium]MBC2755075.1 MtrB/PioB family outer membrane beta-barrel protein [Desulfobacteraceae bacterium]